MKKNKKLLPALLLTLVGTITLGVGASAKVVEVNEKNFPDQYLREAVKEQTHYDYETNTIDTDDVQYLYLSRQKIVTNLTGLDLFTNLNSLSFAYSGSTLTMNQSLQYLTVDMYGTDNIVVYAEGTTWDVYVRAVKSTKDVTVKAPKTKYAKVNAEKTKGTVTLDASNADYVYIDTDVSSNKIKLTAPKVKRMSTDGDMAKSFNYGQYKNLEGLFVSNSATKKITGLDKLTKLTALSCYKTKISSLNVTKHKRLTNLDLGYSPIKTLNVSKLSKLQSLSIEGTKISSINLSNNKRLEYFCAGHSKLKALNVSKLKKLEYLDVSYTSIKKLNVSKLSNLNSLYITGSKIPSVDVKKNKKLSSIGVKLNKGKSFDVSKFIGTGWKLSYSSSDLKYDKKTSKVTLSKKTKESYQWISLKKGKRTIRFSITTNVKPKYN